MKSKIGAKILTLMLSVSMLVTFMPAMAFAETSGEEAGNDTVADEVTGEEQETEAVASDEEAADQAVQGGESEDGQTVSDPEGEAGRLTVKSDSDGDSGDDSAEDPVAKIGETNYASLSEAVSAAADGDTVTMLADTALTDTLEVDKSITLDTGEYTISGSSSPLIEVEGTLTITGSGTISGADETIKVRFGGKLTLSGGTVASTAVAVSVQRDSSFEMTGGTISTSSSDDAALWLTMRSSSVSISGGKIKGKSYAVKMNTNTEDISITDGEFSGSVEGSGSATKFISGGCFDTTLNTDYIADDYVQFGDGNVDKAENAVASVGSSDGTSVKYYSSIKDATAGAADGDTVKVLKDVELPDVASGEAGYAIIDGKAVTFDLNGCSITASFSPAVLCAKNGAKLTFKDSVGGGSITNKCNTGSDRWAKAIRIYAGCELDYLSGTIDADLTTLNIASNATANISGGTIKSTDGKYNSVAIYNSGTLTVGGDAIVQTTNNARAINNNNTVVINDDAVVQGSPGIYFGTIGKGINCTVNGGTISDIDADRVAVTVNGGHIGSENVSSGIVYSSGDNYFGPVTINGGVIEGSSKSIENKSGDAANFVINGGYFSDNEGNGTSFTLPEGKALKAIEDEGTYKGYYELSDAVSKNLTQKKVYDTLAEAVSDAEAGDTIGLATSTTEDISIDKNLDLNLFDYTLTAKSGNAVSVTAGETTLTNGSVVSENNNAPVAVSGGTLTLGEGLSVSAKDTDSDAVVSAGSDAAVNIAGAEISGAVKAGSDDTAGTVKITDGLMNGDVSMTDGSTFEISGGAYKTNTGNGEGFTLPEGKTLLKGANADYPSYYALAGSVVAENIDTEDKYASLGSAVKDASSGASIRLLEDVSIDSALTVDKDITLDLNDKTITSNVMRAFAVDSGASFTVKDAGENGSGQITRIERAVDNCYRLYPSSSGRTDRGVIDCDNESKVTLESGTISVYGDYAFSVFNGGSIDIKGGKIEKTSKYGLYAGEGTINISGGSIETKRCAILLYPLEDDVTLNISGGEIKGSTSAIAISGGASERNCTINITGGSISSDTSEKSSSESSDCTIDNGGTRRTSTVLNISGDAVIEQTDGNAGVIDLTGMIYGSNYSNKVNISGGTLIYQLDDISEAITASDTITISGGWFSTKVSEDYCASDSTPTDAISSAPDGSAPYTVVSKSTLSTAINNATSNLNGTKKSSNGSDVLATQKYVTPAEAKALEDAIAAAAAVVNASDSTAEDIANALTDLNNAVAAFNKAKKAGKMTEVYNSKLPKPTAKKAKKAKKALTAKWKKLSKKNRKKITGFQVQIATDKKFTKNVKKVTVKGKTKVSKKIKKLKSKKTYYIRVRAYKAMKGYKYVGKWSKVKKIKTK